METDAIVNVAKAYLKRSGRVAEAIVRKQNEEDSGRIGYCSVGQTGNYLVQHGTVSPEQFRRYKVFARQLAGKCNSEILYKEEM